MDISGAQLEQQHRQVSRTTWYFGAVTFACGIAAGAYVAEMELRSVVVWVALIVSCLIPVAAGRALGVTRVRTPGLGEPQLLDAAD